VLASGSEENLPPEAASVGGEETPSAQQDAPTGGKKSISPKPWLLPSGSSALVTIRIPKLLRARKLPIRKSTCKVVDLGLGGAGPGLLEPASDPMPTAASSPPVVPPVDAGAAAGRVHNIARNFAVYPIFRFYRRGPIFFLPVEIDFLNICFTKK